MAIPFLMHRIELIKSEHTECEKNGSNPVLFLLCDLGVLAGSDFSASTIYATENYRRRYKMVKRKFVNRLHPIFLNACKTKNESDLCICHLASFCEVWYFILREETKQYSCKFEKAP